MALPAVVALKKGRPGLHLTICCRENLAPLWASCEEVDEVIAFPKTLRPAGVGRLIREHGPFDEGLLLPNSLRSALELRLGGVGRLTGYARNLRSFLLHRAVKRFVPSLEKRHHLYSYLRLVEAMGIEMEPLDELLAIPPPPTPNAGNAGSEIHLGICPGAEYGNAKRYPIERYAEAIGNLRANRPDLKIRVSIFGSPVERQIGEDLAALIAEPRVNRAGQTSIAGLMTELQSCHLVVTNDTGSMHLAAALGVPTVAIFGSTEPDLTAPIGAIHRVIRHKVDCSPCFLRDCPIDYRCMLRIEPAQVVREMEVLLEAAK
jgi:heptosyltransferase II